MASQNQVSVDRDFARFGNKSFAINKINMVEVRAQHPYSRHAVMGWGLLTLIAALVTLGAAQGQSSSGGIVASLAFAALFGALAMRAWKRSNVLEYHLYFVTSSQAVQAIKSRDLSFIEGLRDRIEKAMVGQLA